MGFTYAVEHMEEEDSESNPIPPWVQLEYAHMRVLAGPDSQLHFTHLSKLSSVSLERLFDTTSGGNDQLATASCHGNGVMDLIDQQSSGVGIEKVCLLDPKAENELSPEDGDGRFEWFLFGGILGDDPPRDRTAELRILGFPRRHLGPVQMTTDTALGVTKRVVQDKVPLDKIPYIDHPTIILNSKEGVEMPFRYIADGHQPILPPGMKELLHEDLNKSFDF